MIRIHSISLTGNPPGRRGAIVYGRGLFTIGQQDFNEAFATLVAVESMCREIYFERVQAMT